MIVLLCMAFVNNYANLLRLGLVVGGLYLVSVISEEIDSGGRYDRSIVVTEDNGSEATPDRADNPDAVSQGAEVMSDVERASWERIRQHNNCTRREYQRENYESCDLANSSVYPQDEVFKDDGSRAIFDLETLYADVQ